MEFWDAYDRNLDIIAGMTLTRGGPIPEGVYHLVCDVIVRHTDGDYLLMQRDAGKHFGGMWEATAGGSALQGETPLACAVRELWEETGICAENLTEVGRVAEPGRHSYYVEFLCVSGCAKDSVRLQEGETSAYKWVTRDELISMKKEELVTERMQRFIDELMPSRVAGEERDRMNTVIRLERKEEYREVENLVRESFWNVYRPGCLEHYVLKHLRNDPAFVPELDFVLERDGKLIGQNVFVKTAIRADDGTAVQIMTMGPICIAPEWKRKGYGKLLLDYSLEKAKELGCGAVCFEGNILFYGKSGFSYAGDFGIRYHGLPEGEDASFFLCKELIPGYLNGVTGEYATPEGYFACDADPEGFAAYEAGFPYKEKKKLPGQLV